MGKGHGAPPDKGRCVDQCRTGTFGCIMAGMGGRAAEGAQTPGGVQMSRDREQRREDLRAIFEDDSHDGSF